MKKLAIILVAIAVVICIFEGGNEDAVAGGYEQKSGHSYSQSSDRTTKSFCSACKNTGKISCEKCGHLGYIITEETDENGKHQETKTECADCYKGEVDCPYC